MQITFPAGEAMADGDVVTFSVRKRGLSLLIAKLFGLSRTKDFCRIVRGGTVSMSWHT